MNKRLIIGLGSGRCGTISLAHLFSAQPRTSITHEFCAMPWEFDKQVWDWNIKRLRDPEIYQNPIIGDVGFYWINYIERMLDEFGDVKFVCLKRDRQETMDSYWAHSSGLNVHPTDEWFRLFPRYDADDYEAVGLMWDDYYRIAQDWVEKYPDDFILLEMNYALNTEDGVRTILNHVRIPEEEQVIKVGIKLNESGNDGNTFYNHIPRGVKAIASLYGQGWRLNQRNPA